MRNKIQKLSQLDLNEILKLVEKENIWSSISWQIALSNEQVFGIYLEDLKKTDVDANLCMESRYKKSKEVVACIVFSELDKIGEVEQIFVLESLRNRGIGANLLDFVIELGKQKELEQIWLEVRESNDYAIRLYKSKNFQQTGIRKNYYKKHSQTTSIKEQQQQTPKNQEYENALLLSLTL